MCEKNWSKQIERIFQMNKETIEREFGSQNDIAFYSYYSRFFDNPNILKVFHPKFCKHILKVTNAKGKRVLDIGAGFGLISIYLRIFGAKIFAVEIDPEKKAVFEKILKSLIPPLTDIEVRSGDALEIDFKEEQFDVIICSEVISHIKDLDLLLLKTNKALRRGGFLYIRDCNNALNILQRQKNRNIWKRAENRYKPLRRNIITAMLPDKGDALIDLLAEKTAGMYGDEISQFVSEYLRQEQTTFRTNSTARDPISGIYLEREFNPIVLAKKLHSFGFRSKTLRPFLLIDGRSPFVIFLAQVIRLFHPLSLFASPTFEILAEKM